MKKLTAVLLSAILLFVLASCSSGTDSTAETSAASDSTESGTETETEKNFDLSEMTVGKITKIGGNQVTLDLGTIDEDSVEKPEMPEGVSAPEDGSAPSMPEGASAPEDMPEDFDPDNMPEGFDPDNLPEGASMPDNAGGFSGSITAAVEYTGETAVYTIPAEVKVGSGDYTSLSKGDVIALGFDDDGTVSSVMLITEKGTE